jgi:small subunit ribosomal protein S2
MTKLPGAVVVIDVKREINAVKEARKLGIPTICLIDTDSDPDYADIPIPGNDDAMRAIEVVVTSLCAAVNEGKQQRMTAGVTTEGKEGLAEGPAAEAKPKRSSRAKFRSDGTGGEGAGEDLAGGQAVATTPGP